MVSELTAIMPNWMHCNIIAGLPSQEFFPDGKSGMSASESFTN